MQLAVALSPYQTTVGGVTYAIKPLHRYAIHGLVVSKHNADTWWDWAHATWNDQLRVSDVCMLWGGNLASGVYQAFSFSSGQWTCNYQTTLTAAFQAFDPARFSDNHLLTDSPFLKGVMNSLLRPKEWPLWAASAWQRPRTAARPIPRACVQNHGSGA